MTLRQNDCFSARRAMPQLSRKDPGPPAAASAAAAAMWRRRARRATLPARRTLALFHPHEQE